MLFNWLVQSNSGGPRSDPDSHWELPSFTKGPLSLGHNSLWRWRPPTKSFPQLQHMKPQLWSVTALLTENRLTLVTTKNKVIHFQGVNTNIYYLFEFITFGISSWNYSNDKYQCLTGQATPEVCSIGKCKALYDFTPEQDDELTLKEGEWKLNWRLSTAVEVYD